MFIPHLRLPSGRLLVAVDLLILAWVVLFAFIGFVVYETVDALGALSVSIATAGQAVDDTGGAIGSLELPLVGRALGGVGSQIQEAGQSVIGTAGEARGAIYRLALVSGLVVGVVPSLPLLLYYVPPRIGRARETAAVRSALADGRGDPLLERLLAERAAVHLSFRELRRVSARPWRDLEEGRTADLAAAELRRLGVSPGALARSSR